MSSLCDTNETFLSPKAQGARLVGGVTETESSCRGSKKKKKKKKKKRAGASCAAEVAAEMWKASGLNSFPLFLRILFLF
jgi:hypothetical protein